MVFNSQSVDDTYYLARKFAQSISKGNVIALIGNLGTGKTTFTKGLAKALGILEEQIKTCNKKFSNFIQAHYHTWMSDSDRPVLPNDVFRNYLKPDLEKGNKICLLVLDCMRYDHFKAMMPLLETLFTIDLKYCLSLIPTATPFSRNAIFCGMFPDEMVSKYPKQRLDMVSDAASLNQHEKEFLIDQLKRSGMTDKSVHYHKIWAVEEGKKFEGRIKDYANKDMIALVVNFVDILAHKSSQTDVLKDFLNIGGEEYLTTEDGITVIEWADIIGDILDDDVIQVKFARIQNNSEARQIEIRGIQFDF